VTAGRKLAGTAVFGGSDGLMSILGVVMFIASRSTALVFPVAVMGAVPASYSMGALTKAVHAAVVSSRSIEGNTKMTRTTFRAGGPARGIPVLATGAAATYLADISEFQPDIDDATYLAWSKAVGIRAMYGAEHDDGAWYRGQRRADLHAGGAEFVAIYQYLVAGQSGAAQARAFHQLVGPIQPHEVFVADFEAGDHAMLTAWYNEMLALYGQGIAPYLWTYTGLLFGEAEGALPVQWLADYAAVEPSSRHTLWQFSETFDVPGVGTADCSVFHGTISQLAALAYAPPRPQPPADWTYRKPGSLRVTPGHTNFDATWAAPAGQPTPDHYQVWVYKGTTCDQQTLVPSYPRPEPGPATSPDPGSLAPRTFYTLHVSAFGPGGSHAQADVFAEATFTTGG